MRENRINITRLVWQKNKIEEETLLAYQVTRNHKVSFRWKDNVALYFRNILINLDPRFAQSKKLFQQGLCLSNVLNFTFRKAATSTEQNTIYEMFCFSDQRYIAHKIFSRRIEKIARKGKKNETGRSSKDN